MGLRLQELIHKFEVGTGSRYLQLFVGFLAMVALASLYNFFAFHNLSTPEGMDTAQVARNIAEGRGYSTRFIRPLSIHLVHGAVTNKLARLGPIPEGGGVSAEQEELLRLLHLEEPHPDLANPPLYPVLLAGALKLMPFDYPTLDPSKTFSIYLPDLWIAGFNQFLFLLAVLLVFVLGRQLFDPAVGWVAAVVFAGADLFWEFSLSGLSTLLLVLLFLLLVWLLVKLSAGARQEMVHLRKLALLAAAAGVVVGLGMLSRYAFGWLIVPTLIALVALPGKRAAPLALSAVAGFAILVLPWLVRNYQTSGTPFGTAGFAIYEGTEAFEKDQLERSLHPELGNVQQSDFTRKLLVNGRGVIEELPRLGGSWVTAFFLVGLLLPFRNPTLRWLRMFLLLCLGTLMLIQSMTGSVLAKEAAVSAENLVVLVAPLAFIFGTGLFFVLLDQVGLSFTGARYMAAGLFCLVMCAPLIFTLLPPPERTVVYPPYYPPLIQEKARMVRENELIMSDIPWATSWYGGRQSVWMTLKYRDDVKEGQKEDFFQVHNFLKPVSGLDVSRKTLETMPTKALWDWLRAKEEVSTWEEVVDQSSSWHDFFLSVFVRGQIPGGFPLKRAPHGIWPELFLTDSERGTGKNIQSE